MFNARAMQQKNHRHSHAAVGVVVGLFLIVFMIHVSVGSIGPQSRNPQVTPEDSGGKIFERSILTNSFKLCMIDAGKHLPISSAGVLHAHHFAAGRSEWNENIRFGKFDPPLSSKALIVDVGGNTKAYDSQVLLKRNPHAHLHIYEPVPTFFKALKNEWAAVANVTLHMEGLGFADDRLRLPVSALSGQGTFLMEANGSDSTPYLTLVIRDAAAAFCELLKTNRAERIDVLHVNCEGCEYDMFARLAEQDMLQYFVHIQASFHNYGAGGIGDCMSKYCLIREALERTHVQASGVPFGWERWTRKDDV